MGINTKLFFYSFDFTGLIPQFRIFKNDRYKSIFSTILSIIIILSSIGFSIYSIIEYLQFNNPSISYLKKYDNETIFLKDNLFMFRADGICRDISVNKLKLKYNVSYTFGEGNTTFLNIEPCEIGKNINIEFKDDLDKKYRQRINEFYCISSEHENLSLYYRPSSSIDRMSYITIDIYNEMCEKYNFYIELITENDIIDHYNKNPIIASSHYYKSHWYTSNFFFDLNYMFGFIRYENDNGLFFQNSEYFMAVEMSEINHDIDIRSHPNYIASIKYAQNEKNSSHYRRSYIKIQSLLADIMSIINIMIEIGKIISSILLQKKMNKDIVRSLLNKNIYTKIKEHSITEKNKKVKRLFNNAKDISTNSEKKDIKNLTEKSNVRDNTNKLIKLSTKRDLFFEKKLLEEHTNRVNMMKITIMKKINFFDIIKSYFYHKSKKLELINYCDNFVMEDLCVERILGRLYELEKIFNLLSTKKLSKLNSHLNEKLGKIYNSINEIYREERKKFIKNKEIKDKNKNIIILDK